jgi:hypothetical protein
MRTSISTMSPGRRTPRPGKAASRSDQPQAIAERLAAPDSGRREFVLAALRSAEAEQAAERAERERLSRERRAREDAEAAARAGVADAKEGRRPRSDGRGPGAPARSRGKKNLRFIERAAERKAARRSRLHGG